MWTGGEEVGIIVDEVGTGVGYVTGSDKESWDRLRTRGSAGEEENGSNAGSRAAAGLFTPATGGTVVIIRFGEGAILAPGRFRSAGLHRSDLRSVLL